MNNNNNRYTFQEKKNINKRIKKIKSDKQLRDLFELIKKNDDNHIQPKKNYTENRNGVWIRFSDLSDDKIDEIVQYIDNIPEIITNDTLKK